MDGGAWWAAVYGVAKSRTRLSNFTFTYDYYMGFPGGLGGKESACNMGDLCSIPGSGRTLGGEPGNPLQYSCLGNPMDRGAW